MCPGLLSKETPNASIISIEQQDLILSNKKKKHYTLNQTSEDNEGLPLERRGRHHFETPIVMPS